MEQYATDFNVLTFGDAQASADLAPIAHWAEQFLCAPHPAVGRSGDVCPFTRAAIMKNTFEFVRSNARVETGFVEELLGHLGNFERNGGMGDLYRCRLIVPLRLAEPTRVVAAVQQRLKPAFVARRLMIGQFYPGCDERGLWNPEFRPLQCPVPLIAIRNMVPTDVAFLYDDAGYMATYRDWFAERGTRAIRQYEQQRGLAQ